MQRSLARIAKISLLVFSAAVLCLAAHGQSTAAQDRIVQPVDDSVLTTLKGNVHPLANAQNDLGAQHRCRSR